MALLGGLAMSALCLAAMAATISFPLHLGLRFIAGLVSAFVLVLASALVLDRLNAAGRASLSSLHFAGVGVGIAVSAVAVLASGGGWRGLWLASGALGAAGLVLVAWLAPREPASAEQRAAGGAAPASPALKAMIAAYGLFGFGCVITATFIVAMVRDAPQIATLEPVIWVLFGLTVAPSVALWLWVSGRMGVLWAFALACVVEAARLTASVLWL